MEAKNEVNKAEWMVEIITWLALVLIVFAS